MNGRAGELNSFRIYGILESPRSRVKDSAGRNAGRLHGSASVDALSCERRNQLYPRLIHWYNAALETTRECSWKEPGAGVSEGGVERKDVINLAFHAFFKRRQYLPEDRP
jgi:hypothetical protein